MASRTRQGGTGRGQDEDDEEDPHVYCFIPGEGIDVVVLAQYLKRWVDGTATIRASKHPTNPERLGYTVGASSTLNRAALEDLLSDTKKWEKEQLSREFRRDPYDYAESDTFQERKRKGPSAGSTSQLSRPRRAQTTELPSARSAAVDTGRSRHDAEIDNPPPYGQAQGYAQDSRDNRDSRAPRERANNRSPSPRRPMNPDPDSFAGLSISEDQNRPTQGPQASRPAAGNRHAAGNNPSGGVAYKIKSSGTGNEQAKKGGRHDKDENWH